MISSRILLAGLFCLCPFSLAQKIEPDPKNTLIIISTSDIHGNLDKFPKLATLVKKYRSKFPHVLLMDRRLFHGQSLRGRLGKTRTAHHHPDEQAGI